MKKKNLPFSFAKNFRKCVLPILNTLNVLILFSLFLIIPFLFSCKENAPPAVSIQKQTLIVDVIDPSGTTIGAGWPNPSVDFYISQIAWLEDNGGGILTVFNTSFKIPREISVVIRPLINEPDALNVGEVELKRIKEQNILTHKFNVAQKGKFISQINDVVVNFKPEKKELDLSFLDKNIYSALKKIKESSFAPYAKFVFLYTDFLNEPGGKIKQPVNEELISELNNSQADISVCVLLNKDEENFAVKKLKANMLSSYQDFIVYLNSITSKN